MAADTTYGNGEFLQWFADRSMTPYMRTRDSIHRKNSPFYGPERFTYKPESNSYRCPARAATELRWPQPCGTAPMPPSGLANVAYVCNKGAMHQRSVSLSCHPHGRTLRQRARELANPPEVRPGPAAEKKGGALFGELKNQIGLRRLRLRRLRFVRGQFFLAAAAQNIKRLVRLLSRPTTPVLPATT